MKRIMLILLMVLGMLVSFCAIGVVMLFATGAVKDMQEVRALLSGGMSDTVSRRPMAGKAALEQDAILELRRQRQGLDREILKLRETQRKLEEMKTILLGEITVLTVGKGSGDTDQKQTKEKRLQDVGAWFNNMPPAGAALIMDHLDDRIVLMILPILEERQAAKILTSLADATRAADLTTQYVK